MKLATDTASHEIAALDAIDGEKIVELMRRTGVFTEDEISFLSTMFDGCRRNCKACELDFCGVRGANGALKGFVCFGPTPLAERSFDIYWLAVDPANRGTGMGFALVEHVCRKAREAGARQIVIETSSADKYNRTRSAYARFGFVEVARIPDYYRSGEDRVVFVRKL